MKTYKVVKIWFVKSVNKKQAVGETENKKPHFVSVNSQFKVNKEKTKKKSTWLQRCEETIPVGF